MSDSNFLKQLKQQEALKKHFKEKENPGPKPGGRSAPEIHSSDFETLSRNFWLYEGEEFTKNYIAGTVIGRYGQKKRNLSEFLDHISQCLKEMIGFELTKRNMTSEQCKENFQIIDAGFKALSCKIDEMITKNNKKEKGIDVTKCTAFMHGVINGYLKHYQKERDEDE